MELIKKQSDKLADNYLNLIPFVLLGILVVFVKPAWIFASFLIVLLSVFFLSGFNRGFCFFVFLIPLIPKYVGLEISPEGDLPFLSAIRILTIILIIALTLRWFLALSQDKNMWQTSEKLFMKPINTTILLFLLSILVSTLFSTSFSTSVQAFLSERVLLGVFIFFVTFYLLRSEGSTDSLLRVLIFSSMIVIVLGLAELWLLNRSVFSLFDLPGREVMVEGFYKPKERAGFTRIQSTFGNPMSLGCYLVMIFPFLIYSFRNTRIFLEKLIYGVFIGLFGIVIAMTFVRSAWVLFILTLPYLLIMKKLSNSAVLAGIFIITILIGITFLPGIIDKTTHTFESVILQQERRVYKSTIYRKALLDAGLQKLTHSPFVGVGPRTFGERVSGEYFGKEILFKHHENYYLTLLVESGLFGLVTFLLMLFTILKAIWRERKVSDDKTKDLLTAVFISILGFSAMGLVLDTFSYHSYLFWIIVALGLSQIQKHASNRKEGDCENKYFDLQ